MLPFSSTGLGASTVPRQVCTLLYCIGEEAKAVLASTGLTEDERKVYDTVLAKLDGYFQMRRVIFERARFNRRNQQEGESDEKYITDLYTLSDNCNYGDLREEMIRDRLVVGIRDAALSQQLQLDAELTLEKAKTKIRQREAVREQQKALSAPPLNSADLEQLHSRRYTTPANRGQRRPINIRSGWKSQQKDIPPNKQCTRYGRKPHPREQCPAKDATCHRCNKKGHYGVQYLSKRKQVSEVEGGVDSAFLREVGPEQNTAWITPLQLNRR